MTRHIFLLFLTAGAATAQVTTISGGDTVNFNTLNSNFSWLNSNKMRYLGVWSTSTTYGAQEMVSFGGITYISIQAGNLNHQPDASVSWWTSIGGGGGGGGAVSSVFGRTGAVAAASGDYTTLQVTEATNLYFTNSRVLSAMAGLYEVPLTFLTPLTRSVNTLSCPTCLVSTGAYSQPAWLTSVQGSIISGNISGTAGAHAASHQNGGADEIATATPGANAIPKAGAAGRLAIGFLASGTPDGTRFVRDDGTLAVPSTIGGATISLDNLASVNINTSLIPQTGVDLGSAAKPFRDLFLFGGGTYGTNYFRLTGTPTSTRVVTFPDSTGTVLYQARAVNTTTPLSGGGALTGDLTLTCPTCLVSTGSYSAPSWLTSVAGSIVTGNIAGNAAAHAASHKNGGADEVATATPAANAIPKTGAGGQLAIGFLASGTPDGTKFVRDDGTLAAVGGASGGTVTSVGAVGTANQITVTGASPITGAGSWTFSFPAGGTIFPSSVTFLAGTTSVPSFNLPSGVAPTTPTSGDVWNQSGILKFRDAAITQSLLFHSRAINTTSPLGGGGALTADLTLTCATCIISTASYSQPTWLTSILGSIVSGDITGSAANVTGIVGIPNGGHGQATAVAGFNALSGMTALGDILYGGAAGTRTRLAGNTTTTRQFLRQTGTGSASAVPVWDTLVAADLPATVVDTQTSFSATPTFTVTASTSIQNFTITLTGNVTSSTLATTNATDGQHIAIKVCQDATGSRTFTWPSNVTGAAVVDPTASSCSQQIFLWDGTNAAALTTMQVTGIAGSAITLSGSTSGTTTVQPAATASGILTLPAATDTLIGKATTDTLTNKTFDTAGAGNSLSINGVAATANTGTGAVARAASPTFTGTVTGTFSGNLTGNVTGNVTGNASGTAATITGAITEANTPLTTKGDLLVDDGTTLHRLPVGTNNQVLTADSAQTDGVKWATSAAGILTLTNGAGPPTANCVAPTPGVNLAQYQNTTDASIWTCTATNTWEKIMTVPYPATGVWTVTGATGAAPAAPASGFLSCYFSSTTNTHVCLDLTGNSSTGVRGTTATSNQFLTNIGADGIQVKAQPSCSSLSNAAASCSTDTTVATNITSGTLAVARGGTGTTTSTGSGNTVLSTSPTLVTPLLGTPTSGVATNITGLPLATGVTGTLPVANGGTGAATLTGVLKGNGTSAVGVVTGTATDCVLVNGTSGTCGSGGGGTGVGRASLAATWTAIADGGSQDQTATWTGVTTADTVTLGPPAGFTAGLSAIAWVSAADTVTIRIANGSGGVLTPGAATFKGTLAVFNLSGSGAINLGSISDGGYLSGTFTLAGVAAGDPLTPKWPTALEAGLIGSMVATATDTVTVWLANYSGAALDPASATFGASVAK